MGLSPEQIDAMGLWQFVAVSDGFRRANGPAEPTSTITPEDMMVGLMHAQTMGSA